MDSQNSLIQKVTIINNHIYYTTIATHIYDTGMVVYEDFLLWTFISTIMSTLKETFGPAEVQRDAKLRKFPTIFSTFFFHFFFT